MRVIAGQFRSRNIRSLPGQETRPTYDRLRETLFNVLASAGVIEDGVFVDLFAGTGSIGIEALSRGARMVYFAESEKKAARIIRENLASLGISEGFEVHERDAVQTVRLLDSTAVSCDVCFLDPPYQMHGAYEQVLGLLSQMQMVTPRTIVVAEHDKRFDPGEKHGSLVRYRLLNQGDSSLSFYRKQVPV
jgi:16S rRNA (guanine(966)-N(2))-methyltransferase RsmD